ncbi:hypothetical protein [Paracidovorax sp. MALMAid1276]|uniref:hypothetical protein n=1 Tax=Paracidovorax sp. MALMAid1276 TaxID=3411631 RepID=UPI003B990AC7
MFSLFKDRREQLELMAGFKEAAALSSWTLINLIEQNESFFSDRRDEFDLAKNALDRGMKFSENGNHRVAYMHFMSYIDRTIEKNIDIVLAHQKLVDSINRIRNLQRGTLIPLWEKHQHKLVRVKNT